MWDFYYSAEQEEIMVADAPKHFPPKVYLYKLFDGKAFTEMLEVGEKPVGNFRDMKFVGTGDKSQTRYHT